MRSVYYFGILTILVRIRLNDAIQITITTEHRLNVDERERKEEVLTERLKEGYEVDIFLLDLEELITRMGDNTTSYILI